MLANEKAGIYDPRCEYVIHPSKRRAAAFRLERIESTARHEKEKHKRALELKEAEELAKKMAKSKTHSPNGAEHHATEGYAHLPNGSHSADWPHHQLEPTAEEATETL